MGLGKFRQYRDRLGDESGQSIILISVVILSFLMFFQFAVSTGLLINAKISVQAAADAAAYAGAAVQARQMNGISYLNYDMRRQYKKFIFRYGFVGSMGGAKATVSPTSSDDSAFDKTEAVPGTHGVSKPIGVPVVCIPLTDKLQANDNCSNVSLPSTKHDIISSSGGGSSLNRITQALYDQLAAIESLQDALCAGQSKMNLFVTLSWLFRADPDNSTVTKLLTELYKNYGNTNPAAKPDIPTMVTNLSPLFGGLGLYPRNIINQLRIQTLEKFINEPKALGMTQDTANSWQGATNAEAKERSLQAFQSALANLNASVFDSSLVTMDELQPDTMLTVEPVLVDFNVYIQHMEKVSPTNSSAVCVSDIDPFPAIGAPVGVKLSNPAQVSYAVHLKAFVKPHGLLYLPNSEPLELDAYAGAKPFGSRIGPAVVNPKDVSKYMKRLPVNNNAAIDCGKELGCMLPDLYVGGTAAPVQPGMYSMNFLTELRTTAMPGTTFTIAGIQQAQINALAPTPEEVGHFNILPPPLADMASQYIPYANDADSKVYRFYAPVFPASATDVSSVVQKFIDGMFEKTQVDVKDNPFGIDKVSMRQLLLTQINDYITNALTSAKPGTTENGESVTFAAVELPIPKTIAPSKNNFWLTQANQVTSSWAPTYPRFTPRFGYSVKFVTMRDLATRGVASPSDDLSVVNH